MQSWCRTWPLNGSSHIRAKQKNYLLKVFVIIGKRRPMFEGKSVQFPAIKDARSKCVEKRSTKGNSNPGIILGQRCRYYLKGTRSSRKSILKKTNQDAKQVVSVCSRIHKVDEQPNKKPKKKPFPKKNRKRRQKCSGSCENSISDGLCLARLGVVGFSKRQTSPEKPHSKGTIHQVHATSGEYPGRERTIVGKSKCQSSSSAKPLRCEIWGQISGRDWKTTAMRPQQGVEPCQKHIQAERKRQGFILLARGKMGSPGCVNKRAWGKRVCGRFSS